MERPQTLTQLSTARPACLCLSVRQDRARLPRCCTDVISRPAVPLWSVLCYPKQATFPGNLKKTSRICCGAHLTLNGRSRPTQICTRRRCPSDTWCMRHSGSMSSTLISRCLRASSTPGTELIMRLAGKSPCDVPGTPNRDNTAELACAVCALSCLRHNIAFNNPKEEAVRFWCLTNLKGTCPQPCMTSGAVSTCSGGQRA